MGVGAVVFDGESVVLIKRRFEPLAGRWSLPGGGLEVGETLQVGAAREVREETGLAVDVGPVVEVFDRIIRDDAGGVEYHFVLVDFLCRVTGGRLAPGSDVSDAVMADPDALAPYELTEKAAEVIASARAMMEAERIREPSDMQLSRDAAWALLTEYTQSENLRKHALAVEAAVRGYARLFGEDETLWGVVGLLHDFDYERWPSLDDHPFRGSEILREQDYPEVIIRAILSHAERAGVARESRLEHALFACDEMAGFVTAASLVRPSKSVLDLEAKSVKKRMKDKAFARGVSRDDLRLGAEEIGLPLDEHITNVIAFMRTQANALGLRGSL